MGDTFLKWGFLISAVIVCTFMIPKSSYAQSPSVAINNNNIHSGTMNGPIGPFKSIEDAKRYLKSQGILAQISSQVSGNAPLINPNTLTLQPNATPLTTADPPACCDGLQWNFPTEIDLGVPYNGIDIVKEVGYVEYMGSSGEGAHPYNAVWNPNYTIGQNITFEGYDYWWESSKETVNTNNLVAFYATIDSTACSPSNSCYYPPIFLLLFYYVPSPYYANWYWVQWISFGGGAGPSEMTYYFNAYGCGIKDVDIDRDGWAVCDGDCNDNNPSIHPGASSAGEICTGIDYNCDGIIGEYTSLNVPFMDQAATPWGPDQYNSTSKPIKNEG